MRYRYRHSSVGSVRMSWGSAQEPTALLAVLNAVCAGEEAQGHPYPVMREAGLAALEVVDAPDAVNVLWRCANSERGGRRRRTNQTAADAADTNTDTAAAGRGDRGGGAGVEQLCTHIASLPLMGASPDAILEYQNGTTEVVEVKNHAPYQQQRRRGREGFFEVYDRGPMRSIGAWHIPQLQLEMLCVGPKCRSALFASCSATRGLRVFRVARDDAYIATMLTLLRDLYDDNVAAGQETSRKPEAEAAQSPSEIHPSPRQLRIFDEDADNDDDGDGCGLYSSFLNWTNRIAEGAPLAFQQVSEGAVQRGPWGSGPFLDDE